MKFICGACKTKYTISDEKVRGKVLKVKCKKCEAVVEVREAVTGDEAVARVVAPGTGDSGQGHAAIGGEPRPRLATGPELKKAPLPGFEPRPRTATGGPPSDGKAAPPRPRTATSPPPPPPDALKPAAGKPGTGTAFPAASAKPATGTAFPATSAKPATGTAFPAASAKPATGTAFPAARATGETKSSGVRPAARPSGFLAGGHGSAGGLASSLAEAISASVAPPPPSGDADPSTSIAPPSFVDALLPKASPKEWWAAIRDTPTGPMTREEIEDHIKAGDVDAESLVWREGQDDWRPLRDVHALSELLRGTGRAQLPKAPPGRTPLRSSATPLPLAPDRSIGSVATPIPKGAVAVPAAKASSATPAPGPGPRVSTAGGMFPSSGGGPTPSPGSGSLQIPIEDIPHYIPQGRAALAPPSEIEELPRPILRDDSVAAPAPKRLSPVAWIAICGSLAFGITLALGLLQYLGPRLGGGARPTEPTERVRVVTVGNSLPDLGPQPGAPGTPQAPGGDPSTPGAPRAGNGARPGGGTPGAPAPGKTKALSEADQALLARFQQENGMPAGGSLDPTKLRAGTGQPGQGGGGSALTADQVRAVVARERNGVQSCYERAMRGRAQAEDVRVTVVATVGSSGVVTSVNVRGGGDPGMTSCIQGAVRRWRFPPAAGSSQPEIPFLFTAHATH